MIPMSNSCHSLSNSCHSFASWVSNLSFLNSWLSIQLKPFSLSNSICLSLPACPTPMSLFGPTPMSISMSIYMFYSLINISVLPVIFWERLESQTGWTWKSPLLMTLVWASFSKVLDLGSVWSCRLDGELLQPKSGDLTDIFCDWSAPCWVGHWSL